MSLPECAVCGDVVTADDTDVCNLCAHAEYQRWKKRAIAAEVEISGLKTRTQMLTEQRDLAARAALALARVVPQQITRAAFQRTPRGAVAETPSGDVWVTSLGGGS